MSYITTSSFPTSIDDRTFISDVDLNHKTIMDTHIGYINNGEYTNASTYINSQTDITPITAGMWNMFENQIIALQTYLKTLSPIERATYGNEPESPSVNDIWIE